MSNTRSMTSVQDVLKFLHEHGVQGNTARMEVVNMLDHKQVNTNYWYSPESIAKQLNDTITDYLNGLCGEVTEPKKATMSKLKFELNKTEDRVVIYLADKVIGHIFWCNDMYTLCWEAYNINHLEQQFESWDFSGHFEIATLLKKITTVAEAISDGDWKVRPVGETDEYVINSRKDYDAAIAKIKARFDDEDKCGEYDISSSVEEEKQYHKASLAYIKYLEEALASTQSLVIAYGEKHKTLTTTNKQHDMNANKLKTEESKIQWLENEIRELEYTLSSDCIYRTNLLCRLQMYREHLGMLKNSQNKMIWHPYKDCGDAPKVAEYQKDVFLCKVQMYHSDNDEPVGTPVHQVLLCDDGGIFYGFRKKDGDCYNKVIAWTEIVE